MPLVAGLDEPLSGATSGATSEVPGRFHVALNGRGYMLDLESDLFRHVSIPVTRTQADTSSTPGESSLSRDAAWRATQETWHKGAGQVQWDRADSDPARFRSSKGIDVWTKWQFSLLPATDQKRVSADTVLNLAVAGSYLYLSDGQQVYRTQDITVDSPTWTSSVIHNGEAATTVESITSDGFTVYAALGTNGIHTTERGAATSTHYSALQATLVSYMKGRLMAALTNAIYNVTAGGAAPAALLTHPNTDFRWVGFAEGLGQIFAAGFSGDKSYIYRTSVKADGTALDVPVVAGELPDGEIVRSIYGYLGFIVIGTDKGIRFAVVDDTAGNLTIGGLIQTSSAVRCFEGQDRFVWFGWTNYDSSSTGLGRMDLSVFTGPLTPAYASDIMAGTTTTSVQGNVLSVATFQNRRVYSVSGIGVFAEESTKVASGEIRSGLITFGLSDTKTALQLDIRHQALNGSHEAFLSANSGSFVSLGSHSTVGAMGSVHSTNNTRGETFEIRHDLARSATDTTLGPVLTRHTLKSYPAPERSDSLFVPLLLHKKVQTLANDHFYYDVDAELDFLYSIRDSGQPVTYQELSNSYSVFIDEVEPRAYQINEDGSAWNMTVALKLKKLPN